jgi:AraC-like DNA-binding protein
MFFRTHRPGPPLSDFVELFWLYEGYAPSHAHSKERLLPTGTMELVINLREDRVRVYDRQDTDRFETFRGAVICGTQSEFFVIDTAEQEAVIGVHFRPGGAFPFLHLTAGELLNAHASLESLWGNRAVDLRDRLLEVRTPEARFTILEQTLLAQADRPLVHHPAVAFAIEEVRRRPDAWTVADFAGRVGLSQRRFIQVFTEEVGLTPKLFGRILRFQEVLSLIGEGGKVRWASLAAACGYYDQAHFIRDFRAFSGLNPTAYLGLRTDHVNHVPFVE